MDLVGWIDVRQVRDRWRALLNNADFEKFLSGWTTDDFSKRAQPWIVN
jgi:hypothetical protein